MNVQEIRVKNLQEMVEKAGGNAAFARINKLDASYISQLLNGHRSFGEKAARSMEEKMKVATGLLDREDAALIEPDGNDKIFVTKIHGVKLSAGTGEVIYDFEEIENTHAFNREWLQKKRLDPKRCKLWSVQGDSMYPKYPNGALVLLNLAQREPISGKIFAIVTPDGVRLKRLLRRADGIWEIHSDNPDKALYPNEVVSDPEKIAIYGQLRWGATEED